MRKLYPVLGLLLAAACSKADSAPELDFGPNGGITYRDASNRPSGATDPTDWTSDATWNDTERNLFAAYNLPPLDGPQLPAATWRFAAYPNPCHRGSGLTFQSVPADSSASLPTTTTRVRFVVVNSRSQLLGTTDILNYQQAMSVRLLLTDDKYGTQATYRIYYVVYDAHRVYYRGHGDFYLAE